VTTATTESTEVITLTFATLPALRAPLAGGVYGGLTTWPDGTTVAVVLLPDQGTDLNWQAAKDWAASVGGMLPTRPVAALLFANLREQLRRRWHWTSEAFEPDASYAWYCDFDDGYQYIDDVGFEACALAVRLIPIKG